jgi:mercuric ion transport protein
MPKVELIYDDACPNVEAARQQLRRAFQELGQSPAWQEWDRGAPSSPAHARQYGSPTILVDGKDVSGAAPSDGADCCRVYRSEHDGLQKVPPIESITSALRNNTGSKGVGSLRSWLAVLPAVGVSVLPNLACPACWPVYAGLLSSIGLGFLTKTAYLLPLTAAFLMVAVGALGFRARSRHGFGPFFIGLAAALIVIVGKFQFQSDPAMYGGIALLIAASVWNTWPKRNKTASCPACAQAGHS